MRLMQHLLPQLLTEVPEVVLPVAPVGDVVSGNYAKAMSPDILGSLIGGVTGGLGAIATGVGNIFASQNNSRAQQVSAREETLRADIAARSAAEARAQQLTIIKYVVPAAVLAFTIYLVLR